MSGEDGSYAQLNIINGYDKSDIPSDISSSDSFTDHVMEEKRRKITKRLFETSFKNIINTDNKSQSDGLLTISDNSNSNSNNSNNSDSISSARTRHPSRTILTNTTTNQSISSKPLINSGMDMGMGGMEYGKMSLSSTIADYLMNLSDVFIISNVKFDELPEIIKTFTNIKTMTLINCGLKSLINLPPNLVKLDIKSNHLADISDNQIPHNIVELDVSNNIIKTINIQKLKKLKKINMMNNPFTNQILLVPETIEEIYATNTNLLSTKCFSNFKNLKVLILNFTPIDSIEYLPDCIVNLSVSRTKLGSNPNTYGTIFKLPKQIVKFISHSSDIKGFAFDSFPKSLSHLDLYDNLLKTIPILPDVMSYVDISKNILESVPNIPQSIQNYDCNNNPLLKFTPEQTKILSNLDKIQGNSIILNTLDNCDSEYQNSNDGLTWLDSNNIDLFKHIRPLDKSITLDSRFTGKGITITNNTITNDSGNERLCEESKTKSIITTDPIRSSQLSDKFNCTIFENYNRSTVSTPENIISIGKINTSSISDASELLRKQLFARNKEVPQIVKESREKTNTPQYPQHILKLMRGDGFCATKNPIRKISHQYIYEI